MNKAFSKAKIEKLISKYLYLISVDNIVNEKAYKVFKSNLNSIKSFKSIVEFANKRERENIMKKYFPLKSQTLSDNYIIKSGGFKNEKIFLNIIDNDNVRCFLLKTNDINRIEDEIKNILLRFKNDLDKIYGYWYYNGFITDMNKTKDGYRVIDTNFNLQNWYIKETNYGN